MATSRTPWRRAFAVILPVALSAGVALADAPHRKRDAADSSRRSPYAGEERRAIKALAPEQIEGLRAGRGMGFGRTAELNRYPGPMHVLELASELKLDEKQLEATRSIHARMKERAQSAGARLVEAEGDLDRLFREGAITEANLKNALEKIGRLQAEVRGAHLQAHVEQRALLTPEQVDRYVELRGYGKGHHGKPGKRDRGGKTDSADGNKKHRKPENRRDHK